ncbi:MAG: ribosomal-processing cysteine protease Prp [Dialister sp.]|nr:ribosomal-processing cysteine protease Prp [Dialister sp.]
MITVCLRLDEKGLYSGFTVSGHAGKRKENEEYDLVCAAVSAIVLTAVTGLSEVADIPGTFTSSEGYLLADIEKHSNSQSQLVIETMLAGLKRIQEQYPDTLQFSK